MALYNPELANTSQITYLENLLAMDADAIRSAIDLGGLRVTIGEDLDNITLVLELRHILTEQNKMDGVRIVFSLHDNNSKCLLADFVPDINP